MGGERRKLYCSRLFALDLCFAAPPRAVPWLGQLCLPVETKARCWSNTGYRTLVTAISSVSLLHSLVVLHNNKILCTSNKADQCISHSQRLKTIKTFVLKHKHCFYSVIWNQVLFLKPTYPCPTHIEPYSNHMSIT